jgi:superfamily II DNA or RNA helicase
MAEQLTLDLEGTPEPPDDQPIRLTFDDGTLVCRGIDEGDPGSEPMTWDDRIDRYRAPAVAYRRVLGALLRAGWTVVDEAREYTDELLEIGERMEPYPHQAEGLEAWLEAECRGTVVLPTGSGKTYLAQLAIEQVDRSTLVVVPTIDLMNQWSGIFERAFDCEVGLLGGGSHEDEAPMVVSTYDSAAMHMERIGDRFGMVVFDEVHHLPSDFYRQAAEFSIAPFRLGLTATPERSDGRHDEFGDLVGPIVYRKSIKELSGDVLADYEIRTVEVGMTPEDHERYEKAREFYRSFVRENNIRMSGSNGWMRFLAATNRSERGRKALEAYRIQKRLALVNRAKVDRLFELLDRHRDDPVLIFTNDNDSVWEISERALVPSITHETKAKERKRILGRFNDGQYGAIVTSKVLNEGVDVPRARVGTVLSGSGSVREHVQRLGRILRQWKGERAILYELVTDDTVEEHVSRRRRQHDAYE